MTEPTDLTGKLLIAMPGMGDPRFERAVIFLCAHGEDGAMGLIVNKPATEISLSDLLEQLDIPMAEGPDTRVHFGGPVEGRRGFVLHSPDYEAGEGTLDVEGRFGMTATLDVLRSMGDGAGPRQAIVALGYAGWGPGQIESEIAGNGWLVADADPEVVFGGDDAGKWMRAIEGLGFDPILLSGTAGTA
ncbi:DUF179 domain-containing protein [Palleronia sediminis]|uniref:UPF0301 protein E2L08_05570 n=1 Tax=Palleronia sediminis TaxID=2547833 RepID=A0A4R6AIS6_9RHOB|nr:YqgE/AlgH family protein [Palleronia sediminis]TDL81586.1 DUF179 domain-containing protein [Palleronia sediminis]